MLVAHTVLKVNRRIGRIRVGRGELEVAENQLRIFFKWIYGFRELCRRYERIFATVVLPFDPAHLVRAFLFLVGPQKT